MPKKFFSFCIVLAIRVPKSLIPLQVVEVGMYRQGVTEQIQCCVNCTKPPLPKCSKYLQIQASSLSELIESWTELKKAQQYGRAIKEGVLVCVSVSKCDCELSFYVCMCLFEYKGENTLTSSPPTHKHAQSSMFFCLFFFKVHPLLL